MEIPEHLQPIVGETLSVERDTAFELSRPSFLLKPTLLLGKDGWWRAYYAQDSDGHNGIVVMGRSPNKAYAAFDAAWNYEQKESE